MAAQPGLVNLRWPPGVRLTCQPSSSANSMSVRSRLCPRASSWALAMACALCCGLRIGPAGHEREALPPLRE